MAGYHRYMDETKNVPSSGENAILILNAYRSAVENALLILEEGSTPEAVYLALMPAIAKEVLILTEP